MHCLTEVFSDLEGMQEIGRRWLEINFNEMTHSQMLRRLISRSLPQEPEDLRRYIAEARERDFQNDDIVIVDGWILSRTEVHICALAFLLGEDRITS